MGSLYEMNFGHRSRRRRAAANGVPRLVHLLLHLRGSEAIARLVPLTGFEFVEYGGHAVLCGAAQNAAPFWQMEYVNT